MKKENLKIGTIETVYKVINKTIDPVGFFNRLKNNSKYAFLLESADIVEKCGDKSIGCVEPCLKIVIRDHKFTINALNNTGQKFLKHIKNDFSFVKNLKINKDSIKGSIEKEKGFKDEDARLKEKSVFDILRIIAFKFKPKIKLDIPFCGLFGMISYDAIDYFENLPKQEKLANEVPDMEFYFADKLFVMDHIKKKTYLIANLLVTDKGSKSDCGETIDRYEGIFNESVKYKFSDVTNKNKVEVSVSDENFKKNVKKVKENIANGDIFQCVISRTFKVKIPDEPLNIYARLKDINPGPYMFYFQNEDYILLGSSPETCLKVQGEKKKTIEIKPIAGTLPRGKKGNKIDPELDSRYESELLLDKKELAEHCMLLDLARNDVAKVSKPSTRTTPQILKVEKFSHVMHIVSDVQGILKPELDALHAYMATMNMGTLTGAPKIKAMELIRKYEKEKREFYGGAVCYLTPFGDFDSCIIIRAITIKGDNALVRAGSGIVYDSNPENETEETKRKARACMAALGVKE